ncbi:hypothetical protein CVT26_011193, partial [Gymnopilus dilepis]
VHLKRSSLAYLELDHDTIILSLQFLTRHNPRTLHMSSALGGWRSVPLANIDNANLAYVHVTAFDKSFVNNQLQAISSKNLLCGWHRIFCGCVSPVNGISLAIGD